ncbi:hypothetical protein DO97_10640 [Neosynechococcus sphagnicola sy1]|uniref:Uncharacterized protein n=1 Tax=Neosynechococcus sphagnicola sy1 TaxID=1497020 RepID=A0A098TPM6_9CYAN|nr:hypothetical protein DO97_10640 [Neosynechococcus sphagnicola sy1]
MSRQPSPPGDFESSLSQVEQELMAALLHSDVIYPWNPAAPDADAYLDAQQQAFVLPEGEGMETKTSQFFDYLDQLWSSIAAVDASVQKIEAKLVKRFAVRVPRAILETISQTLCQSLSTSLSLADRLVECAQEVLPQWNVEDLQVLARPLAYAMRGMETEVIDAALRVVRPLSWTDLTEIEQARLSLAIARYALTQVTLDPETHSTF